MDSVWTGDRRIASRRQALKALGLTALGGAVTISQPGQALADFGSTAWQAPVLGTPITGLAFRIFTGNDNLNGPTDLLPASAVDATVVIRNRFSQVVLSQQLNNPDEGWPDNTRKDKWFSFARAGIRTIVAENIQRFNLHFTPNQSGLFGDNWNMNSIAIAYTWGDGLPDPPFTDTMNTSQFNLLFSGSGSPYLHRFRENPDAEGGPDFGAVNPHWNPTAPQRNWRWCNKCQGLFFNGNFTTGSCPAGGGHNSWGSWNYVMFEYQTPVPPGLQEGWRWCNKCQGMTIIGFPAGVCPAGGNHNYSGSASYTMFVGDGLPGTKQGGWRYCYRCLYLFFAGNNTLGRCAAGGSHSISTFPMSNYMLPVSWREP